MTKGRLAVGRGGQIIVAIPQGFGALTETHANVTSTRNGSQAISSGGEVWPGAPGDEDYPSLPAVISGNEVRITAGLPPGSYVLTVGMWFERGGDVFYGVVLEVR